MARTELTLGFIPLTDAAPLILAKEAGHFADLGLDVTLTRERSWARLRDKLAHGMIEGAHLLQPMVVASALDISATPERFATACALNFNGNAVTFSNALCEEIEAVMPGAMKTKPFTAKAVQLVAARRLETGRGAITLAIPYPYSTHNYLLRFWLAHAGLHPDRDVRLIAAPPPDMVDLCAKGDVDGFCVGEPWGRLALDEGIGRPVISGHEIWSAAPEKVFGVRQSWLADHGDTHMKLVRALLRAIKDLEAPAARERAAGIMAGSAYLDVSRDVIARSMEHDFTSGGASTFDASQASYPWVSKAAWVAVQMIRWNQLHDGQNLIGRLSDAFRSDIYGEAALAEDVEVPFQTAPLEGEIRRSGSAAEGTDRNGRFFDGSFFRPENPIGYLERFHRHSLRRPLEDIFRPQSPPS